ncbi:MAG: MFS transporter [Deltaproteobacteria bacterium]|nr:MAG: MFS transporter [Deltaproteobacteria bacterium]
MTAVAAASGSVRAYAIVTASYWAFTLTDGALRMLVLLHFHALGYTPLSLASLFLLYEVAGVFTNLFGGWIAARLGLDRTLRVGLALQVGALAMLSALSPAWPRALQVAYVVAAQGLSGVAKDFTKLSAKSAIKTLVPEGAHGTLFRWVALLTGSKNALKGAGFFAGGALLAALGFRGALWAMAGAVVAAAAVATIGLPRGMGRAKAKPGLRALLAKSRAINVLSAARLFLFCARDVWFVVGLPVFLYDHAGWSFVQVAGYMAAWVIGYGVVQAVTPRALRRRADANDARAAQVWGFVLAAVPVAMVVALRTGADPTATVVAGLAAFGVVFAINSAVHSYLVLAYSDADATAADVGFYYMANAGGRLLGTVLSGALYQAGGLTACLIAAAACVVVSSALALWLPDPRAATAASP